MLRRTTPVLLTVALAAGTCPGFGEDVGSVTLPLADYLSLVQRVDEAQRLQDERRITAEPDVAEVVEENRRVVVGDERAEITSRLEVEVRGEGLGAVALPVTGALWKATVEPASDAALWQRADGLALAVTKPGRYVVNLESACPLAAGAGVQTLSLAPITAAVAMTEVDLPAELAWSCPGAAVAGNTVTGNRRLLQLALNRHADHHLELRRELRGAAADELLAKTVVVTLLSVRGSGVDRHDVVLYEVSRGALAELEVSLPEGLTPTRLASDEGELPAVTEAGTVIAQRRSLLTDTGFLVISSRVEGPGPVDLAPVLPAVELRSRYLTSSTAVAAEVVPTPAERWLQVDISDLPGPMANAAARLDLGAAWRWQGKAEPAAVTITRPAPVELVPTVVNHRDTITLLTVDGTLLHRDRLDLTTDASALELELSGDATLWSSVVDDVAVRPLRRDGTTVIPLPFGARHDTRVEVVVVQQRAVPPGRSSIDLELPRLRAPVLDHRWRLLLPEENRYRYAAGTLAPAPFRGWRVEAWQPASPVEPSSSTVISTSGGTGQVRGSVVDAEGRPMPGVTIQISSPVLIGGPQVAICDAEGQFTFNLLPPGQYRLDASLVGFRPVVFPFELRSRQTVRADLSLSPEMFGGEIEVSAQAPVVDVARTGTGRTFETGIPHRRGSSQPRIQGQTATTESTARQAAGDLDELSQGLVGGVRPVPVDIPERGKALDLEGTLPPPVVTVQLEVKAGRG